MSIKQKLVLALAACMLALAGVSAALVAPALRIVRSSVEPSAPLTEIGTSPTPGTKSMLNWPGATRYRSCRAISANSIR